MGKLINRIPGLRLLISSLPGSALRTHVESQCQQAFSKPCLVNLISKDTHLVFSIYQAPTSARIVDLTSGVYFFFLFDNSSTCTSIFSLCM